MFGVFLFFFSFLFLLSSFFLFFFFFRSIFLFSSFSSVFHFLMFLVFFFHFSLISERVTVSCLMFLFSFNFSCSSFFVFDESFSCFLFFLILGVGVLALLSRRGGWPFLLGVELAILGVGGWPSSSGLGLAIFGVWVANSFSVFCWTLPVGVALPSLGVAFRPWGPPGRVGPSFSWVGVGLRALRVGFALPSLG